MILADPEAYWTTLASRGTHKNVKFTEEAVAEYKANLSNHEGIHAVRLFSLPMSPADTIDMRGLPRFSHYRP